MINFCIFALLKTIINNEKAAKRMKCDLSYCHFVCIGQHLPSFVFKVGLEQVDKLTKFNQTMALCFVAQLETKMDNQIEILEDVM